MLSCWVIYNGSLVSDKFQDQAQLMAEAAERQGIQVSIMKNYEIQMSLSEQQIFPDFAVLLDKDILLGYFLKSRGVPVYNDPAIIDLCDNKATQYIRLSERKIPMPKTIVAPKVYPNFPIQGSGYYEGVLDQLGLPMIIKEGHGSFGMKVYLIETEGQFYEKSKAYRASITCSRNSSQKAGARHPRQYRRRKIVAAMKRQSDTDFRANITNGGRAFPVELTPQQEQLALDAAQAVGAVFAGVDLLYGPDGQTLVCEVNAAAHIRNILNVTGVNVADAMMRYIQEDLA
ncbi:ATP-grasp domain-containing protein [Planococcus sp. MB-3u-03]|uniref:ATP-grasp domain-containing protein n=1 Tax=Planococcus sp. MB-3u-03 TaxID=2058136 RepID=UPI0012FF588C|nr:RimK family alpha-L-glutamate ligase [Planococcus sp. MB-3u-03]